MQKELEILELVRGVNFEFIDSLKNNGTKYLLIFDDSCDNFLMDNFVLSMYQALKFTNFKFGWCRNWNFPVGFCSTTASYERRRSRHLLYFT